MPTSSLSARALVAAVLAAATMVTAVPAAGAGTAEDEGAGSGTTDVVRCLAAASAAGTPVSTCRDPFAAVRPTTDRTAGTDGGRHTAAVTGVGTIVGTVTGDDTGRGVPGVCVDAFSQDTFEGGFAETGTDGRYELRDLPPGDYLVAFFDCREDVQYVGEYHDDAVDFEDADVVRVRPGATVVVDAGLRLGGFLTGTVTTSDGGALASACVTASSLTDVGFGFGFDISDADGTYRLGGLATGDYLVAFSDCSNRPDYAPEYYDDVLQLEDATLVAVSAGVTTPDIDAELVRGASVSGTVTDAQTGAGLDELCVEVIGSGEFAFGFAASFEEGGAYRVGGLVEDTYQVRFADCGSNQYVREFHEDAVRRTDLDLVTLSAGSTRRDLDAALEPVSFADVRPRHPFRSEIHWAAANAIATGYDDGSFRPDGSVTRQAMSAFLWRLVGEPPVQGDCTVFSDVPADHPFCTEIAFMAEFGLSEGYADGTFRPGATVDRAATSAFLARFSGNPPVEGDCTVFSDVPADHPFCTEIAFMAEFGLADGYADGTFRPTVRVTRQAMAAFLQGIGGPFGFGGGIVTDQATS